jgi:hypothetical protein
MSRIIASASVAHKIDRSSYRRVSTPFGYGILLPPAPPTAPLAPITPAALAEQIRTDLARLREIGRRQDALLASLRSPLPPIAGGSPEATDKDLDSLYEESRWLDHVEFMHRDQADQLI